MTPPTENSHPSKDPPVESRAPQRAPRESRRGNQTTGPFREKVQNHIGLFLLFSIVAVDGALFGGLKLLKFTVISDDRLERLARLENAALAQPVSNESVSPKLVSALKNLPQKSRALLMLMTQADNKEVWGQNEAEAAREAAVPLRNAGYARELSEDELRSMVIGSGQKLVYGLQLVGDGAELHDQMVQVLSAMLGTAEAADWIKERRHEPSPAAVGSKR